ncbi:MAG: NADH:flavin oxidoreductase/NADH oxidase family protein [Polyangiaceae bacterium]|nr:NADH:flavin oxidoreductase/NADH oxidase family protein [Polyangiaceae bacterium]
MDVTTIESPLRHGPLVLRNRIAKSAMSERLASRDGAPTDAHVKLYEAWSRGGSGLLITGNVMVDAHAVAETGNVVVQNGRHHGALAAWARATRSGGAAAWAQINHPGRQAPRFLNREAVAPSAVPLRGITGAVFGRPRALAAIEIERIVERFAVAASVLVDAGFDGIQIHAAHGYLINQFLSPLTNQRDDAWGGDADRRMRFLMEVVRSVRSAIGREVPLGVKLNSADFQRGGFTEEESMRVVAALEAEGIELLEISGGTYESAAMFDEAPRASTKTREAFFLGYAEKVRKETKLPLLVTGGFRSRAGMDAALESGAVDLIGLARPLANEPDLPARLFDRTAAAARHVRLTTGMRAIDSVIQGGYHQAQIRRLSEGLLPNADLSRVEAVVHYVAPRWSMTPTAQAVFRRSFA